MYPILTVAERLIRILGGNGLNPIITKKYRVGDIRHCFADISLAEKALGFAPRIKFEDGLSELAAWLAGQKPQDRFLEASAELTARRLTI